MHLRELLFVGLASLTMLPGLALGSDSEKPDAATTEKAVAMVCWLTGEATVRSTVDAHAESLALLDRLPPGAVVETGPGSQLTMVFVDGARAVVEAGSRAVIQAGGAKAASGRVRRLKSVPAAARLLRIARSENPGRRPGAGRIRDTGPSGSEVKLYPRDGAALLKDAAILRFTAAQSVEEYHVEVTDLAGEEVFAATTRALEVLLPTPTLRSEALHYWRLSSQSGDRTTLHGDGLFMILGEATSAARRRLAEETAASGDPGLEMLLAEADRRLGLRREACLGLASAARHQPEGALEPTLQRFACQGWPLGL